MCIYPFYWRSFCLQPQDIDKHWYFFWKATHGVGDWDFDLICRVLFKPKLHDWDVVYIYIYTRVLKDTSYISNTPHINIFTWYYPIIRKHPRHVPLWLRGSLATAIDGRSPTLPTDLWSLRARSLCATYRRSLSICSGDRCIWEMAPIRARRVWAKEIATSQ